MIKKVEINADSNEVGIFLGINHLLRELFQAFDAYSFGAM